MRGKIARHPAAYLGTATGLGFALGVISRKVTGSSTSHNVVSGLLGIAARLVMARLAASAFQTMSDEPELN